MNSQIDRKTIPLGRVEPSTNWRLTIVYGPGSGKSYQLVQRVQLGRVEENDIFLPGGQVSRQHAVVERVTLDGGAAKYQITDQNSTNGTFVNNKRITGPIQLKLGDTIQIGEYRFVVLSQKA